MLLYTCDKVHSGTTGLFTLLERLPSGEALAAGVVGWKDMAISTRDPCDVCLSLLGQYRQVNERRLCISPLWSIAPPVTWPLDYLLRLLLDNFLMEQRFEFQQQVRETKLHCLSKPETVRNGNWPSWHLKALHPPKNGIPQTPDRAYPWLSHTSITV